MTDPMRLPGTIAPPDQNSEAIAPSLSESVETMGADFHLSWTDYHQAIERLALRVYRSGWQFDSLVCLSRGGLRVGDVFSRLFRQRLAILSVSSYGGELGRDRGELAFAHSLSMVGDRLGPRLLVVDDLADSGATLQASVQWLRDRYDLAEIRTAVLWVKGCSAIVPDYYDRYLPHNPWIHQPFERYETLDLSALDRANPGDR